MAIVYKTNAVTLNSTSKEIEELCSPVKLQSKEVDVLLSDVKTEVKPDKGFDGFYEVVVNHSPVESNTPFKATSNGQYTITPSEGFDATTGVNLEVEVTEPTPVDTVDLSTGIKFSYSTFTELPYKLTKSDNSVNFNNLFNRCTMLVKADLSSLPKITGESAPSMSYCFDNCWSLTTVILPEVEEEVQNLEMSNAFNGCTLLSNLEIPFFAIAGSSAFRQLGQNVGITEATAKSILDKKILYGRIDYMFYGIMFNLTSDITLSPYMNSTNDSINDSYVFAQQGVINSEYGINYILNPMNGSNYWNLHQQVVGAKCMLFNRNTAVKSIDFTRMSILTSVSFESAFEDCSQLESVDFSRCVGPNRITSFRAAFQNCPKLKSVKFVHNDPEISTIYPIDYGNTTTFNLAFYYCSSLTDIDGIPGLKVGINFSYCPLTRESVRNVIDTAATVTDNRTFTLNSTTYASLTEEDIAAATAKGWGFSIKDN